MSWTEIWKRDVQSWTEGRFVRGGDGQPIAPHEAYITIVLRSLRLTAARVGFTKFHGVVHASTSLAHNEAGEKTFHFVKAPQLLQSVDPKNLDRVVNDTHPVVGPVPYRGGSIAFEMGLFAVVAQNLLSSYISILERMSDALGVSWFANTLLPLAEPFRKGVEALGNNENESVLEIGVSKNLLQGELKTGCYFVMRAPADKVRVEDLVIDEAYRISSRSGQSLAYPYMVYTIEQSDKRDDFARIPQILDAYRNVSEAVRRRDRVAIDEAFQAFSDVVSWSPDYLERDAKALVQQVRAKLPSKGPQQLAGWDPLPPLGDYKL